MLPVTFEVRFQARAVGGEGTRAISLAVCNLLSRYVPDMYSHKVADFSRIVATIAFRPEEFLGNLWAMRYPLKPIAHKRKKGARGRSFRVLWAHRPGDFPGARPGPPMSSPHTARIIAPDVLISNKGGS